MEADVYLVMHLQLDMTVSMSLNRQSFSTSHIHPSSFWTWSGVQELSNTAANKDDTLEPQ